MKVRKSRLLAGLLCLLLAVTSVVSLSFPADRKVGSAAPADSALRFKQIAAGADFAIGLTYNNDLYGWSLLDSRADETTCNTGATTLGEYYPGVPKRIALYFVQGPSSKKYMANNTGAKWTDTNSADAQNDPDSYWKLRTDDAVKYIAATATAAAFISEQGFIYTWGRETNTEQANWQHSSVLLRGTETTGTAGSIPQMWYQPCIINYNWHGASGLFTGRGDTFFTSPYAVVGLSLYAGENTFYLNYGTGTPTADTTVSGNLAWGASDYDQRPGLTGNENSYTSLNGAHVIGGGGTAAILYGGNLYIKGKNYYLPAQSLTVKSATFFSKPNTNGRPPEKTEGIDGRAVELPKMFNIAGHPDIITDYLTKDGTSKADWHYNSSLEGKAVLQIGDNQYLVNEGAVHYYPRKADTETSIQSESELSGGTLAYYLGDFGRATGITQSLPSQQFKAAELTDATTGENAAFKPALKSSGARMQQVSFGNGFGYFIGQNNKLYAFGNNNSGQRGAPKDDSDTTFGSATDNFGTSASANISAVSSVTGNVLAVAAGLTRSRAYSSTTKIATLEGTTLTLTDAQYVDSDDYLSGALAETGLFVWNKSQSATNIIEKFEAFGVSAARTSANRIATVFSGYGNNLFAISSLGKMFRITYDTAAGDFTVTMYDRFVTDTAADAGISANYQYRTTATKLDFTASNARSTKDPNARIADGELLDPQGAVLTLDALTAKLSEADERSYCETSTENYSALIPSATNRAGDAFRILLNGADCSGYNDGAGSYLNGTSLNGSTTMPNEGRLVRFYLNSVSEENELLPGGKLDWYLDYKITTYATDVQIEIFPYRATKPNEKIIMTYMVGRYDTAAKFTASKTDPVFYDFFEASAEITIANTKAVGSQITPYLIANGGNGYYDPENLVNSSIPLLDPNYELNRYYSIAITDISSGFAALNNALNSGATAKLSEFERTIQAAAATADKGYPAATKASDAYMRYLYNQSYLDTYFNGDYQYFVFDRDGDRIDVSQFNQTIASGGKKYFDLKKETVSLTVALDGSNCISFDDSAKLMRAIDDFNNTYGLTVSYAKNEDGELELVDGKVMLTVSYAVITITANVSTNTVSYGESKNSLQTVQTTTNVSSYAFESRFQFQEFVGSTGTLIRDVEGRNDIVQLPLHAQSSLRTLPNAEGSVGAATEKNRITIEQSVTVGAANNSRVDFDLTANSFVRFTDSSNLYFTNTYKEGDATLYEGYALFAAQFDSEVCDVTLSRTKLMFSPKQEATYKFSVAVRRDSFSTGGATVVPFADDKEVLYLDFVVTAAPSAFVNDPSSILKSDFTSQAGRMVISASRTVSVSDMTNLLNVRVVSVSSSDTSKLSVSRASDGQSFTLIPSASGQVKVAYVLEQYGRGYSGTITVQVEGRSTLPNTLSIVEREAVMFTALRSRIQQDNSSTTDIDFGALELDTFTTEERPEESYKANGWYFIDPVTKAIITDNNGLPAFVSGVELLTNAQMVPTGFRIAIGNYNSTDNTMPSAIFVVCFKVNNNAGSVKKFEGAVYVQPTTRFLKNPTEGGDLVMRIDMKASEGEGWTLNSGGKVSISLDYLRGLPCLSGLTNLDKCRIRMVTTTEEAAKYFTYENTETSLTLTPDMPVSQNIPINVAISDPGSDTAYVLTFYVTIDGIRITLEKSQYLTILLSTMGGVFAVLLIIFVIRMGLYWRRKAEQKRIIKKNQMLIRMRDKVHNSAAATTREQIVKTKLKLEDPKYAKMFNDMRRDKEAQTGITLDNSMVAQKVDDKIEVGKKAKKKKKGKKSIEDLKAELEAKKAAFQQMQQGDEVVMDQPTPVFEQGAFDPNAFVDANAFGAPEFADGMSGAETPMDAGDILFDVEQVDNNNN